MLWLCGVVFVFVCVVPRLARVVRNLSEELVMAWLKRKCDQEIARMGRERS